MRQTDLPSAEFSNLLESSDEIFLLTLIFPVFYSGAVLADCSNSVSEADDGYRDAKRAYNSDDLDSCQSYARKAYRHGSYAEDEANSCR